MSTLPSISSYPMVTPAVTKPRQLAPTVGQVSKSVIITGEALRGKKKIALGEIISNRQGNHIVDEILAKNLKQNQCKR